MSTPVVTEIKVHLEPVEHGSRLELLPQVVNGDHSASTVGCGSEKSASGANIDHLVIGPSGAWLVETDSHRGAVRQNQAGLWAGKVPLRAMLNLVSWMGEETTRSLVAELPDGWQLEAQPVVAFAGADLPGGLALVDGLVLLPSAGVADYVLSAGVVLKPLDVAMLVDVAERVFPPYEVSGPPPSWPALSRLRGLLRR